MPDRRAFLRESLALLAMSGCRRAKSEIVVGCKNFTEQLILGEIFAQMLEHDCRGPVQRRFYLAGTYICQQAILAGRIDVYPEYTGTALAAVLKQKAEGDASQVYEEVKTDYLQKFDLDVMPPLGFNNSFAMVMRGEDAKKMGVTKLSELAPQVPQMRLGVGYEFLERADGYKGLVRTYDLEFGEAPRVMDLGLLYRALQNRTVDLVAGSNTDGLIAALGFVVLEDDRHYFPPYDAVPIVRPQILQEFPPARGTFAQLAGRISAKQMRQMNYAVDGEKRDAAAVAREFLQQQKLLVARVRQDE